MSKQSERRKRELSKAKAEANLLNSRQQPPDQSSKIHAQSDGRVDKPKDAAGRATGVFSRPGVIAIIGTVLLAVAAFIQTYSHSFAIWVLFLALLAYGQALKIEVAQHVKTQRAQSIAGGIFWIGGFLICLVLQMIELQKPIPAPSPPPQQIIQNIFEAPQDYIDGTQVTRKQFEQKFPYGYAIFYLNDEGQKEIHEFPSKLAKWNIDWNLVKIEPNVPSGQVTITMPVIKATGDATHIVFNAGDTAIQSTFPFVKMAFSGPIIQMGGIPVPYFVVLDNNERKPVFAIGFRIPTPDF